MPGADRFRAFRDLRCQMWLIALVMTTGCATSQTKLKDSLAQRVPPVEVDAGRKTSQLQVKAGDRATIDTKVQPAIASQPGLEKIFKQHPHIQVIAAAVDPFLNDRGYIVPGLGDAGDRSYGHKR